MKPFVLLATRTDDEIADAEYAQFCRHADLDPSDLLRVRLEQGPMPRLDLDEVSGVMIGGSPFTTSVPAASKSAVQLRVEADLSAVLDRILAQDVPLLGACYGVGTLGIHAGAIVDGTYGEEPATIPVRLTAAGRADPLVRESALPEEFLAIVGHKEAVRTLPPAATLLARGEACPVQMFRLGHNRYATQFHPELDVPGLAQRLHVYRDAGYMDPAEIDPLIARVSGDDVTAPGQILRGFARLFAR